MTCYISKKEIVSAVFPASLTLMGILAAVVGVFYGQLLDLERQGLSYFADRQRVLVNWATIYFCICATSAFFSFLHFCGISIHKSLLLAPTGVGLVLLSLGVPISVWCL